MRYALIAILWALLLGVASQADAQLFSPARVVSVANPGERVFDNGGQPWAFFSPSPIPAIAYDQCGQGCAYNVTPSSFCSANGSSYRSDYVNFKTSTFSSSIPFQIGCNNGAPNTYNFIVNFSQPCPCQVVMWLAGLGGSWNVLIDGVVVATVTSPNTGPSFTAFQAAPSTVFNATSGNHILTFAWASGDPTFNSAGDFVQWQGQQNTGLIPDFGQAFNGSIPTEAMNAGFTHLVANFDFSNSFYATQSNWLDTGTSGSQWWHSGAPGAPEVVPLNIFQGVDPSTADTVMIFTWLSSYVGGQGSNSQSNQQNIQTVTNNGVAPNTGIKVGNFYVESQVRYDPAWGGQAYLTGGANEGPWTWSDNVSAGTPGLEMDTIETSLADGSANGNMDNHAHPVANGIHWTNYNSQNTNLPGGYAITAYHTYGGMLTSDGATSGYGCLWVDHLLQQGCESLNFSGGNFTARNWFVMTNGPKGNNGVSTQGSNPYRQFVKYVRIWSCANWSTQMCNGTALFNGAGLIYWH